MKFDIKDLQVLEAIQSQGTFAKAAEQLHRTPSAVTQSIKKLEDLLGFSIFDRSSYRPTFTTEGQLLLERGKHILKQINHLEYDLDLIKQGWETEFSIAYDDLIATEAILELIKDFQKIAPGISIQLHREVLNGCWDALLNDRAVLAIGASGEPPLELTASQKTLGTVNFVFAVASHHPLASASYDLTRDDIMMYPSVVISDTSSSLARRSSGIFVGQSILKVPSMDAKIKAQVLGLGIGYLPRHRVEHLLKSKKLVEKMVDHQKSKTYLKAAWRTDKKSQALSWFLKKLDSPKLSLFCMQM